MAAIALEKMQHQDSQLTILFVRLNGLLGAGQIFAVLHSLSKLQVRHLVLSERVVQSRVRFSEQV